MTGNRFLLLVALLVTLLSTRPVIAAEADTIPVGTVITMQNWQQYKDYMPDGMQWLFEGKYFWKFPPDFRLEVGPTHHYNQPQIYAQNTEKYASQVKIVDLPDGGHSLSGYVAGAPFPNPQEPHKGWKILVDEWYRYVPYILCGTHYDAMLEDRYGHTYHEVVMTVYRRLSHISDFGQPINDPQAQAIDYSEYIMVTAPEQSKYTANITFYYLDPAKSEDLFLFIPALRRSLRLSSAARCSPFIGTDLNQDDPRTGFNGGIVRFDGQFLRDQPIITMTSVDPVALGNPANFYQPLDFPGVKVGQWEVRDTWVTDVRRIPSQRSGYCYGKRIMYVDKASFNDLWNDLYDSNMKPWKIAVLNHYASEVPHEGIQAETGNFFYGMYDLQNDHLSNTVDADAKGRWDKDNEDCRNYEGNNFDNIGRYSSVSGLSQIMR